MESIPKQIRKVNGDELNIESKKKTKYKKRIQKSDSSKPRWIVGATSYARRILTE